MTDSLIHFGNALYLVAYAVKDILWLRVITVIAAIALIPAYYMQVEPLTSAIVWELVFAGVNVVWIALILRERRPVKLGEEAERLRTSAFKSLTSREMKDLLSLANWQDAPPGELLIEEDVMPDRVMVIAQGTVDISVRGEQVGKHGEGAFLGEISFLTNSRTTANVITAEPTRYVWWRSQELRNHMESHPELRTLLLGLMGADTATKLASR